MNQFWNLKITREIINSFLFLSFIAVSFGYLGGQYIASKEENFFAEENAKAKNYDFYVRLSQAEREKNIIESQRNSESARNENLQSALGNLSSTVNTLQKYAKTDKELLAKYSKVFFLNENYTPDSLSPINSDYVFDKNRTYQFLSDAYYFLATMIDASRRDGIDLEVASSYRSFKDQSALKSSYKVTYGTTAANKFSADQGYSEHQLGTAVDLTTKSTGGGLTGFDKTKEYTWLLNNAYKYGFIISYPKTNNFYIFEPWHWRFVGIALATKLHNEGKYFYDLDQRDINEYLVNIFDKN